MNPLNGDVVPGIPEVAGQDVGLGGGTGPAGGGGGGAGPAGSGVNRLWRLWAHPRVDMRGMRGDRSSTP